MKKAVTAFAISAAVVLSLSAVTAGESPDRVETLRDGKATMEKACKICHSLSRSLSKNKDRQGWDQTIKRMVTYGAPLNKARRDSVASYLTAKSSFETNCNACHSNLRVLSDAALGTDWKATVDRMAKHLDELSAKDQEARRISAEEIQDIGAYLTIVIPRD
jgi:cytochrome c5